MLERDTSWLPHLILPWSRVTLLDGSSVRGGYVMRRKVNGKWQYRQMTVHEAAQEAQTGAW